LKRREVGSITEGAAGSCCLLLRMHASKARQLPVSKFPVDFAVLSSQLTRTLAARGSCSPVIEPASLAFRCPLWHLLATLSHPLLQFCKSISRAVPWHLCEVILALAGFWQPVLHSADGKDLGCRNETY